MRKRFISDIYEQCNLLNFKTVHRLSNNPLIDLAVKARHTYDLDIMGVFLNIRNVVEFMETDWKSRKRSRQEGVNRIILA